jgi:hypothetical protein
MLQKNMERHFMRITDSILSIPPYISTPWSNISSLYMRESLLVITLREGNMVHIPGLPPEAVEAIFNAHAAFLEKLSSQPQPAPQQQELPFKVGFSSLENLGAAMQHNPAQADMPDLPEEILARIGSIAKALQVQDLILPKAEPHCNCPHCQVARAIAKATGHTTPADSQTKEESIPEEPVSDQDLQFEQWTIHQEGEKLYTVINKLEPAEKYSVFLGNPVGCTCGVPGCEHILAVLKS